MSRINQLAEAGQSIWLDYIDRPLLEGGLSKLIAEDGVRGVTSNPAIFQKAISGADYADTLKRYAPGSGSAKDLYEAIAIDDIQRAADILAPVYAETQGVDGYVSLEVSPDLARNTDGTIAEAKRLWAAVSRPNLMVKVPGTPEGMPAIRALIAAGINVNVTLLFARDMYRAAARAYMDGIADRHADGHDVTHVASVASFFVSRIDASVDPHLAGTAHAAQAGKTAIANALLAYQDYLSMTAEPAWQTLSKAGAMPQRLLWASTGVKNPEYSDVLYIEELVGPDTVNTVPPATLDAYRDHGETRTALPGDAAAAAGTMDAVANAGVDLGAVTDKLLDDGITQFVDAFVALLDAVETARVAQSA
ncbi:MAG: transaldolase [Pseudomonadota bacterium]